MKWTWRVRRAIVASKKKCWVFGCVWEHWEPQKSTFTRFMSSEEIHEQHGECRGSYSEGKREISEVKVSLHSIIARWGMRWMWQSLIFLLLLLFFVFISIRKSRQCFPTLSSSCGSSQESPSSRLQLETWFRLQDSFIFHLNFKLCIIILLFVPHIALYSCDGVVNSMKTKSETLARQTTKMYLKIKSRETLEHCEKYLSGAALQKKKTSKYWSTYDFCWASLVLSFCAGYPIAVICYVNFQIFPLVKRLSDTEHFFLDRSNNCTITKWKRPTRREQSQL